MPASEVSFGDIEAAAVRVRAAGLSTPQIVAPVLSETFGAHIRLKLENLQPTGSFKVRGALNKLASLTTEEVSRGVIAMSAGNHAQGVAYHARRMGMQATIVMPLDTPFTKIRDTEKLGATVVLEGETLAEARAASERLANERRLTMIHPYDDPLTIAGQGTIAMEFLAEFPDLDCLVVPVGGGGLIAGICVAAKHLKPNIEIIGVETELFPSMRNALRGESHRMGGRTVAEGIAVAQVGLITQAIAGEYVADIVLASENELERAMLTYVREQHLVVEGAGAAPLAAIIKESDRYLGRSVGLIVSGGNVDSRLLSSILLRGLTREGFLVRIRVEIEDRPGELAEIAELIGKSGANIVEVVHQRLFSDIPLRQADVDITLETRDPAHVAELLGSLASSGFTARLLNNTAGS